MKKSKKEKSSKKSSKSKVDDKTTEKKAKKADKKVNSSKKKTTASDDEAKSSKKSKVKVVDDKVAEKKAKDKKSKEASITTAKTKLLKLPELIASESFIALSKGFDSIEDKMHCHSVYLKSTGNIKHALSTGILHYDLMLGGGLAPGKMTVEYGGEGCAKSTRMFTAISSAITTGTMPIVHDAEAALNAGYVDRILRHRTGYVLDDLVGEQDERGNWIRLPYMRYYQETIGQRVFRHIKRSLDLLPDVIEDREGNFYKIWRDKSGEISRREEYDGSAQAAYFIDSAAALIPEANDDNDEAGAMAAAARMFAWGFPLIKGRVSAKRVVLFFTNQVRTKPGVIGGCIHSDTTVPFADGRVFTMEEVVKNKIKGLVWSHNEATNKMEKKRIIGWHHNGYTEKASDWVHIETASIDTINGTCGMTITTDHKVDTERGWIQAKNLKSTDRIATRRTTIINGKLREFLCGTFIGDCSLVAYNNGNAGAMKFSNKEQLDYLAWKLDKLSMYTFNRYEIRGGAVVYRSNLGNELSEWKKLIGKRSAKNIVQYATPLTLAVWYMDDGHCDHRDGRVGSARVTISAKRFSRNQEELSYFSALLHKFGITHRVNLADGSFGLTIEESRKLFKTVCRYIPECMQYKLPELYRNKYKDFKLMHHVDHGVAYLPIKSIREASARQMRKLAKYDITVADNHNYMIGNYVNGLVVHNSGIYMTGGDTFKHNNDCRSFGDQRHPKALDMPAKPGENYTREKSINGGEDKYHYQRLRNEKNKMFTPRRSALMRTRLEHDGKPGDGVCETYDSFQYLRSTGQLVKRGDGLTLNVEGTKKAGKIPDLLGANGGKLDWHKFKMLVEMPENKRVLQKHCQAQLISGYAFQLEAQAQNKGIVTSDDNDGD